MAFGLKRDELKQWKKDVESGKIAFLTHFWIDDRFPGCNTVTKVGCNDLKKLKEWGSTHGLNENWIHYDEKYPHFDLFGEHQKEILLHEKQWGHIEKFKL
ncbi:hypothetical protein CIL05_10995 [Virgibacillus profundi]|uniref:YneQ n=1 Tax=Virgibacillus profundi TaxID=2024555 RepID=A0A2A2IDD5_9BACI|nr:hypothetical protein [Virgibacillus profundi]PAV29388.1 hypothetical protein CIL05_10995 [Virgibacillus profundi]PXY53558.1 hypothetical protein CIT14_11105 [Virgibacillus profundi]